MTEARPAAASTRPPASAASGGPERDGAALARVDTARADAGVRSVVRALELLGLFDIEHPQRTLKDLVEATGLPKTTVVRLGATLQQQGLLTVAPDGSYALGGAFLRWVRLADSLWSVSQDCRTIMRELVDSYGETVNVYVRQGRHRMSIAQHEGTATVRSVVVVGAPLPLEVGAPGRVLLSATTNLDADVTGQLDDVSTEALRRSVAAVRETGYAVSHGEREIGASSVAAPIRGADGRLVAALALSGPTSRFTADRVADYVRAVTAGADRMTAAGLGPVEALL